MLPKFKFRQCGSSGCKDYLSGMNVLTAGIPDSSENGHALEKNAILLQIGKEEENVADTL